MNEEVDVVIIGGGLSGLNCARLLHAAKIKVLLLEATDGIGGVVRTDIINGFNLDRGFQVLLTSYPEYKLLDIVSASIKLKNFLPGAYIRKNNKWHLFADPFRYPRGFLQTLTSPTANLKDKLIVCKLKFLNQFNNFITDNKQDQTTEKCLFELGFSNQIIDSFFKPFFGGVFLEKDLLTPSSKFKFLFNMFSKGSASLPANGMGDISRQLANFLPTKSIKLNNEAINLAGKVVTTASGLTFKAKEVVIASAEAEERLLNKDLAVKYYGSTTIYFATKEIPQILNERFLLLNGEGSGYINSVCCLSTIAPSYAPANCHLISVAIIGIPELTDEELEKAARSELTKWFNEIVDKWQLLKIYKVKKALPAIVADSSANEKESSSPYYLCGAHIDGASINGALSSGRVVAEKIIKKFVSS